MIHRKDLISHFEWLSGSEYYDEAIDEAIVAIAFTASGHGNQWMGYGAAWATAGGVVEMLGLERFVTKARRELPGFVLD